MTARQSLLSARRHTRGLTLIELLVSLVLGLLIVLAATSTYLGSSGASRVAEAQSRMNEDGQAALAILSQQIRMAGNNPDQVNRVPVSRRNPVYLPSTLTSTLALSAFSIRGCDGKATNVTSTANIDGLTCLAGTNTLPDTIAISYEADRYNTPRLATGRPSDCLGNQPGTVTANLTVINGAGTGTVTNAVTYYVADNRFFVGTSTAIASPSLYCRGNGGGGAFEPLVENIEDLQITYGTVPAGATSTSVNIAGYLSAASVLSEPTLAALADDAARWGKVVAVRICVVARSEGPIANDAESARYLKCDGSVETNPPDLRLRRAYTTTVVLRNRL